MDFKEEWNWLNSYQMEAVTDGNDACIVNANVGSGKTTVLIAKILYLHYEKKIPLEKMVVLTFTNKAAGEIIERLKKKRTGTCGRTGAVFWNIPQCCYADAEKYTVTGKSREWRNSSYSGK